MHLRAITLGKPTLRVVALLVAVAAGVLAVSLLMLGKPAQAAWPGTNGKIAFSSNRDGNYEIYTMNPDGSQVARLTNDSAAVDTTPAFSPDGSKIVWTKHTDPVDREIWIMNTDGSGQKDISNNPAYDMYPSFSPDGKKVTYQSERGLVHQSNDIIVSDIDGTNQEQITTTQFGVTNYVPRFSPNGSKILFFSNLEDLSTYHVYTINPDGTGLTKLTNESSNDFFPSWSPDGKQIIFQANRDGNGEIYVMNADGTGQKNLTNNAAYDDYAVFSPDGKKILFESNRSGSTQLYTMNSDGTNPQPLPASSAGDTRGDWGKVYDGLVAYYPFSGDAKDASGNGHDGTLEGGANEFPTDVPSSAGAPSSLSFDGSDDAVSVPDDPALDFDSSTPMTISLWAKKTSNPGSGIYHILGKREGCDTARMNYQLARDHSGFAFTSSPYPEQQVSTSVTDLTLDKWTHLAVTYDPTSSTLNVYADGELVGSASSYELGATHGDPLMIGASGTCGNTFPGLLDEVRIYNRALNATEIGNLAESTPGDITKPTVTITTPPDGAKVRGTTKVVADASDDVGVEKVEFLVAGVVISTDESAPYEYDLDTTQWSDGSQFLVQARAYDAAGNQHETDYESESVVLTIDNAAPEASVDSGPDDPTTDNSPAFEFSGSDNLSEASTLLFSYKLDESGEWSEYSADASLDLEAAGLPELADGEHTFYVKTRDEAGNESAAAEYAFSVDTTAPEVSCPADSSWHEDDVSLDCTAQDSGSGLYDEADASFTLSTSVPDASETDDAETDTREVCDKVYNCTTAGPINGLKVDKKAPESYATPYEEPNEGGWHNQDVAVTLDAYDYGSGVASISYALDGGQPTTVQGDTTTVDVTAEGTTEISYYATDELGNEESAKTLSIKLDKTAPDAPVIESPANNSYDTDGDVTLSGTAEANSTVYLYEDLNGDGSFDDSAEYVETATADAEGDWSFALTVADGPHSYAVTASDEAGNYSPFSEPREVTVDGTAPATSASVSPSNPNFEGWYNTEVTITLTASDGANGSGIEELVYAASGAQTIASTSDADGEATVQITTDGTTTVSYRATDKAGNVEGGQTLTVRLDKTAPSTPSISLAAASDTGSSNSDGITNDATPTFSGTAEANSTVAVYDGSTKLGEVRASGTGAWSFTPATALANGNYSIKATATDEAGNASAASAAVQVSVDTARPAAPVVSSPTNNSYDADGTITFTGTAEANATVRVYEGTTLKGTATVSSTGTWSIRLDGVTNGRHSYNVRTTDAAGNTSAYTARTVTVDTARPDAPVISSPVDNSYDPDGTITLSGAAEANSTIKVYEGTSLKGTATAGSTGAWSKTLTGVANGPHTYTATATDRAGNVSAASAARTITVDSVRPRVTLTSPTANKTGVARLTNVTATFSEKVDPGTVTTSTVQLIKVGTTTPINARVTLSSDGKTVTLDPFPANAATKLELRTSYEAKVTTGVKDLAGNAIAQEYKWTFTTGNS